MKRRKPKFTKIDPVEAAKLWASAEAYLRNPVMVNICFCRECGNLGPCECFLKRELAAQRKAKHAVR